MHQTVLGAIPGLLALAAGETPSITTDDGSVWIVGIRESFNSPCDCPPQPQLEEFSQSLPVPKPVLFSCELAEEVTMLILG